MTTVLATFVLPTQPYEWIILVVATVVTVSLLRAMAGWPVALTMGVVGVLGCIAMNQVAITVGIMVVAALLRIRKTPVDHVRSVEFVVQTGFVLAGLAVYQFLREQTIASREVAVANAESLLSLERSLPIPTEAWIQDVLVPNEAAMQVFNAFYFLGFLGFIAAVLCWLYFEHPDNFKLFRNGLAISATLAVFTIAVFPVAPPRMIPEAGVIDTVVYLGQPMEFTNPYAAVPSLHVGWTALAGMMMGRIIGGRRGLLVGFIPGVGMTLTVIATGNHYIVDAVVGTVYSILPVLLMERWTSGPNSHPAFASARRDS